MKSLRFAWTALVVGGVLSGFQGLCWGGGGGVAPPRPAKKGALDCFGIDRPVSLDKFLAERSNCPPESPVGRAFQTLQKMEKSFPGILPGLADFGLSVQISRNYPRNCDMYNLARKRVPQRHFHTPHGAISHGGLSEEGQEPQRRSAAGLYCTVQKLAWADQKFPDALLAELFHAIDHAAMEKLGREPTRRNFVQLVKDYGPLQVYFNFYGNTLTSIDPEFYRLWDRYVEDLYQCPKGMGDFMRGMCRRPPLGPQGVMVPIELFMEIGIHYFAIFHGEDDPSVPPLEQIAHGEDHWQEDHGDLDPGLEAYFKKTVDVVQKRFDESEVAVGAVGSRPVYDGKNYPFFQGGGAQPE